MSIEDRDDMNLEEDLGKRGEAEDVEGHASKKIHAVDDGTNDDESDDVEAHSAKRAH